MARLSGRGCRNKGKRGEREVIKLLQPIIEEVYGAHGKESPLLQRNTLQSDRGGFDIVGLEWLALEVKFQDTLHVEAWWEQACRQAGQGTTPALLYRQARARSWTACLFGHVGILEARVLSRVTVTQQIFLTWFRQQLNETLTRRTK